MYIYMCTSIYAPRPAKMSAHNLELNHSAAFERTRHEAYEVFHAAGLGS